MAAARGRRGPVVLLAALLAAACHAGRSSTAHAGLFAGAHDDPPAPAPALALESKTVALEPFRGVQVCLPFSTLVLPTPAGAPTPYALSVEAEPAVLEALTAAVVNSTLQLQAAGALNTSLPVKLIVYLPSDQLSAVATSVGLAEVTVGPGFDVRSLALYSPFGTSNLNVLNATVESLDVRTTGSGAVFVNGSIVNATVSAGGVASVYVIGLEGEATVNLGGAAQTVIGSAAEGTRIMGVATGVNTVIYDSGLCGVQSAFPFGQPCQQQQALVIPIAAPQWSCGVAARGAFQCPAGGLLTAGTDASFGLVLNTALPSFLAAPAPTPAAAAAPAQAVAAAPAVTRPPTAALPEQPAAPTPAPPLAAGDVGSIPGTAGATTTTTPGGQTVTNVGPGMRTAIAQGPGSQTAIAGSGNVAGLTSAAELLAQQQALLNSIGRRRLQQTGNAALDQLYKLLGASGTTTQQAGLTAVPSTLTATSGPGSLACAYANGQGGCQSGGKLLGAGLPAAAALAAAQTPPLTPPATDTGLLSPLFTPSFVTATPGSSSSISSSISTAGGGSPPQTFTSTTGPGASACSFANGQGGCQQNGSPVPLPPGFTLFGSSLSAASAGDAPAPAPGPGLAAAPSVTSEVEGVVVSAEICQLPAGQSLDVFAA